MSMNDSRPSYSTLRHGHGAIGLLQMLGILFIALKLTGYIDWSWWLVLMPLAFHIGVYTLLLGVLLFLVSAYIARCFHGIAMFVHNGLFGDRNV